MIRVTRLNGDAVYINSGLIEFIEETPDTVITFTTGKKLIVTEKIDHIIEEIIEYNRRMNSQIKS